MVEYDFSFSFGQFGVLDHLFVCYTVSRRGSLRPESRLTSQPRPIKGLPSVFALAYILQLAHLDVMTLVDPSWQTAI